MEKKLPIICPCCEGELKAQSLHCDSCQTSITGSFELPLILKLEQKDQDFIMNFVLCSGSLKLMAQQLKLSYPTVRNMLDDLISKMTELKNIEK